MPEIKQTHLKQLAQQLSMHAHEIESNKSIQEWRDGDAPFMWKIYDQADNYTLLVDIAYGHLALFRNDNLIDVGTNIVSTEDGSVLGLSDAYLPCVGLYFRKS
jgi:hypothetical protein